MGVLQNLKIELLYDPAIPLLDIYSKMSRTRILKVTCAPMFVTALFTTAKTWKQSMCPSTDDRPKNMLYIYIYMYIIHTHTLEYYSAIKIRILPFMVTSVDLRNIILSQTMTNSTSYCLYVESEK